MDLPGNMSDYVLVKPELDPDADEKKIETLELPTEEDGTLLLSVLKSQFERATGLKYRFIHCFKSLLFLLFDQEPIQWSMESG